MPTSGLLSSQQAPRPVHRIPHRHPSSTPNNFLRYSVRPRGATRKLQPPACIYPAETAAALASPLIPHSSSSRASTTLMNCTCNAGYHGLDGSTCSPCPAGSAKKTQGVGACETCRRGSYATSGSSVCVLCPVNTYSNTEGAVAERSNSTNASSSSSSPACTACPATTRSTLGRRKSVTVQSCA